MTPREQVEAVLLHKPVDRVPFTIYECMLPQCAVERQLRNKGLCIVNRHYPTCTVTNRDVEVEEFHRTDEKGEKVVEYVFKTPVKTLRKVVRPAPDYNTHWVEKTLFDDEGDYEALECIFSDRHYEPDYENFKKAEETLGGDVILRAAGGDIPWHEIMMTMGVEKFCFEWIDNRDRILRLHDILVEKARARFAIVADSPALHANFGGNINPDITSPEVFREYKLPLINEFAELMHSRGKLVGCHLDDKNGRLAPLIAETKLDIIEAFTPPPDCDLGVREALELWPDKILWLNFPSSVHLSAPDVVEETTRHILRDAAPGNRIIMGITEDIPPDKWQESLRAIMRGIEHYGNLPIAAE